jgi:hypothetical protein
VVLYRGPTALVSLASAQGLPLWLFKLHALTPLEDFVEYFCLDHPPDRLILCHPSNCKGIADYLEVSEQGGEDFVCAAHKSSVKACFSSAEGSTECRTEPEPNRCLTLFCIPASLLHGGKSEALNRVYSDILTRPHRLCGLSSQRSSL